MAANYIDDIKYKLNINIKNTLLIYSIDIILLYASRHLAYTGSRNR